jgi:multidrug resistance efflux pump
MIAARSGAAMEAEKLGYKATLDKTLPGRAVVVSRVLFYSVLALVLFAVSWMSLTRVDVVVDARGRLMVEGEPVKISVPETGIVTEALVDVGDHVAAGQVLLRLDPFRYNAAEARLLADIDAAKADAARYRSAAQTGREIRKNLGEEARLARVYADVLTRQLAVAGSGAGAEADLPRKQLEREAARSASARAETALAKSVGDAAEADQQAVAFDARVRSLGEQLAETRQARDRLALKAPAAGTITQAAALHAGVAVSVGEPAVILMPDSLPLLAALKIPNASMRRLRAGDGVRLRFDAYPHEDFGDIHGQLLRIDPDADDQGLYRAWVRPEHIELLGPAGAEKLRPGLQLDAKILIERKTVLMVLLKPLHRLTEPVTTGQ